MPESPLKNSSALPIKQPLIGLDRNELAQHLKQHKQPNFRSTQLWQWLYQSGADSFAKMSNFPNELRQTLESHYELCRPTISLEQKSIDGTMKWLLRFADGNEVEMVFIPEKNRGTLCVSSQVGCTLTCSFCHTGTQRMVRNLTAAEIISQVLLARDRLSDWPSTKSPRTLTNIVFMGMGEPLLNYDQVIKAITLLTDPDGLAFSKRRITLSTSGIVPNIVRCGTETGVNLAISLHATTDALRNELVPINKKYPLAMLLEACRNYPNTDQHRRITFEYVMLKDINDSQEDAKRLVQLIKHIPAKVNLIPFNPWPGSQYTCSNAKVIEAFSKTLYSSNIEAPIRTPRGQDILAACGQLKSTSERLKKKVEG